MGKGRWAGVGCATLFALPFCAAGIAVMFSAERSTGRDLAVRIGAGSVFVVAGLALIFGAIAISGALAESVQLKQRHPDQPWMWRRDWAANAVNDQGALGVSLFWIFAIIWNLISLPMAFAFPWREVRSSPIVIVPFLFPAIGVLMLIGVLYATARRMKFGASVLHLDQMPIVPGRTFHGELETRIRDTPAGGFTLRLTCVRRTMSGRSSNETVLWQETQQVALATPGFEGVRVPFSFALPPDAEVSQSQGIVWRLDASAELPGIDYAAVFQMPVFASGASPSFDDPVWPAPQVDAARWSPDPRSHITITPMPSGGEEFRVGAPTTGRFGFIIFLAVWFGIIAVMTKLGAPLVLPVVFGGFGLLILAIGLDWMFGHSVIRADRAALFIHRSFLGIGSPRTLAPRDVNDITTSIGGSTNGVAVYNVTVVSGGGEKITAAKYVAVKRDAEMLAARIKRAIG